MYNVRVSEFMFNVAKVSDNEVNVCKHNPCDIPVYFPASETRWHQLVVGFYIWSSAPDTLLQVFALFDLIT